MPHAAGLYYELDGPEDGARLILSSGLGGSADYWRPNMPALTRRHRVLTYDHRGTGRSDRELPERVTVEHLAEDMLQLMDALGWERASIVGHAAGGVAGLSFALAAPERLSHLVVVNGWVRADPHFLRCFQARLALLHGSGPEAFLRAQPIFLYPATWISTHNTVLDAELPQQLGGFAGAMSITRRVSALAAFDISDRIGELPRSLLTIAAKDDMLVPYTASDFSKQVPGASSALMEWGGHACNVTDPDGFNRITLNHLGS